MFGTSPAAIGTIMRNVLSDDWDAFNQLCALFDNYLLKDSHLSGEYERLLMDITKWPWSVAADEDQSGGEADAETCEKWLRRIPRFRDFMMEAADAVGKGFSAVELQGKFDGEQMTVADWEAIPQYALKKIDGAWHYKKDSEWPKVPAGRLLIYERSKQGDLRTGGIMWPLIWLALFKNFTVKDWMAFVEVYSVPLRLPPWDYNCRCWTTSSRKQGEIRDPAYWPAVTEGWEKTSPLSFWKKQIGQG